MEYNFTLIISNPTVDDETASDLLYEAGCDDATYAVFQEIPEISFIRESTSPYCAIRSAIEAVKKSGIGSDILAIVLEPDSISFFKDIEK